MKKNYIFKVLTALLISKLAGTISVQAAGSTNYNRVDDSIPVLSDSHLYNALNMLSISGNPLECSENSMIIWQEDFGTLSSEDARSEYTGMNYEYAPTGKVEDGKYAVTANPRTCGQDNYPAQTEADNWFRSIYDHTQGASKDGAYGGMLLINCRDGQTSPISGGYDVVLEKKIWSYYIGCVRSNIWLNFSAWFANADWARGKGVQQDIKMELWICDGNGNKKEAVTVTAGINEGWKRGIISTAYDGGDIVLKIVNYGESGGGNKVLIDDIQLEICRPVMGITAETLEGKVYDDIKNVRIHKCGDKVVLTADPADSFMDVFPIPQGCPYYMWLQSDDGWTWEKIIIDGKAWQGNGKCDGAYPDYSKLTVSSIDEQPMYYRALIGLNIQTLEAYFEDPWSYYCAEIAETPAAYIYCTSLKLSLEKEGCNEYEAEVENAESGHTFKWEYGNDTCGWTVIDGQTGAEIKFDAKAYFDILNKESTFSADCCEVGIMVTDNTSGDIAVDYVNAVYIPSLIAELVSQENNVQKYRLTADITDACWNESLGKVYEFYKDGLKIDRCQNNTSKDGSGTNISGRNNNGTSNYIVIDEEDISDCDYDPVYITEPLLGGTTYNVKFGGDDEVMFCEASIYFNIDKMIIENGIVYKIGNNLSVVRLAEQSYSTMLTIPEIVEYENKRYTVTSIDAYAFNGNQRLNMINIPKTITSIGDKAFNNCTNLTEIITHTGMQMFNANALNGCSNITLTIAEGVTNIEGNAYKHFKEISSVQIPSTVSKVGGYAFSNCTNLKKITCMSTTPPSTKFDICSSNEYENVILYVPCSSIDAYENDEHWGKFVQIRCIEANTVDDPTSTPQVSPGYTTAEITWPTETNAGSYVLTLTIGSAPFCILVFNENGQLNSINFNNTSTERSAELRAAIAQAKGYKFTVTGLSEGTLYNYSVTALDSNGGVITTYTNQFKTLGISVNIDNEKYLNKLSLQESISVKGRLIQTNCENNSSIRIFNTAGIEVNNPVPTEGVYIVTNNKEAIKVVVR